MKKSSLIAILCLSLIGMFWASCSDDVEEFTEDEEEVSDDDTSGDEETDVTSYGDALSDQVTNGDGNGIDDYFRNSGVVIDEDANTYFAVNGVHPVNSGDYSSYYPKSIVEASLDTDEIVNVWSFDATTLGREVDMEGLTFAGDTDVLYIGDEYNFIYELDLETGEVTREWDLADIGVVTAADRGIEAITYLEGSFYVGIQADEEILELDLHLEATDETDADYQTVELVSSFSTGFSPSGLFGAADGSLYVVAVGGNNSGQIIYNYSTTGTQNCTVSLTTDIVDIERADGIYLSSDETSVYIADSQGALNGKYGLYRLDWSSLSCE